MWFYGATRDATAMRLQFVSVATRPAESIHALWGPVSLENATFRGPVLMLDAAALNIFIHQEIRYQQKRKNTDKSLN